jgi:hypothetical protein
MNCPKCNAEIVGMSKFCTKCGCKLVEEQQPILASNQVAQIRQQGISRFCTVCGANLNPNMKFCTKCGTPVGVTVPSLVRVKNNEKVNIDSQEFIIGKKQEMVNYCIADNPAISRVHAKIINQDGQYFIIDLGSTNHTYVNGTKIPVDTQVPLSNGVNIRMSNEEFIFQS